MLPAGAGEPRDGSGHRQEITIKTYRKMNRTYQITGDGYYGAFGGAYIPEILYRCVEELRGSYLSIMWSEDFRKEYSALLKDYVGRPTPLYLARRLSEKYGCRIYLKREDLNHTVARKSP